jgi:crotonobetainyl-CoA:carnitine CoA-transferase CaiB-like acyl-CoA transferase
MPRGPLEGAKFVELAGIGPGPMCAMTLADMGATVIRIDRVEPSGLGTQKPPRYDLLLRNRRIVKVDLKRPEGVEFVLGLVEQSDGLIEGFRPGVTERLGLGPEDCFKRNPRLAYGRMTGWGQDGPLSQAAGHDLNYIAITGALAVIGRKGVPPVPPLNLLGDYVGGVYLAMGLLAAMWEAKRSGKGQVVDAAMCDTTAVMMTNFYGMNAAKLWNEEVGTNALDGGSFYYEVYETRDGKFVTVGPIEGKFFAELLRRLDVDPATMPKQTDRARWQEGKAVLAAKFKEKTRDEWTAILEGTDACFAPVLTMAEAPAHPHLKARGVFAEIDGAVQPMPAPRFSRTPSGVPTPPDLAANDDLDAALAGWSVDAGRVAELRRAGVVP